MTTRFQGVSKIYGLLLGLFPREFQWQFKAEMEEVFTVSLEEASKMGGALVVQACFFELLDLPVNLVVEHLSNLRKGNGMKITSFEVGRARAVLMGALGMGVGWVLTWLLDVYCYSLNLSGLPVVLVAMIAFAFPVILCGLMLGIAAGVKRRAFLRIGLWTAAGGMLGHLVSLPIRMVNSLLLSRTSVMGGSGRYDTTFLLGMVAVMCAYGLFYGAGLGLAFGNWKASIKFGLIGLVANAVGVLAGYFIATSMKDISNNIYITWSVTGILAGGVLGWFFGKGKQPEADPFMRTDNA